MAKRSRKENPVLRYLRETRSELRKVHWPTRKEAWALTKIVLAVTGSMAIFLGFLDYLFTIELRGLINSNPIAIGVGILIILVTAVVSVFLGRRVLA